MEIIILILLLIIAAEATYLVALNTKKTLPKKNGRAIFVDTSVLIDGRILSIAESGFITDTLLIPRSVIGELQYLADNADAEKRARARHGLDVVSELQAMTTVSVDIFQDGSKAEEGVDERLLKLAKQFNGAICTIDFNLNKVAQVEHIPVLNVNDLAMSLRMAYLPGEKILLELTQKGNDGHQAVGHLVDGTMVVVEHANKLIGQTVEIEFIRSLQTSAGKMMFAKPVATVAAVVAKKPIAKVQAAGRQPRRRPIVDEQQVVTVPPPVIVEAVEPSAPTVYHSDAAEQSKGARSSRNRSPYQQSRPQDRPRDAQTQRTSKKPRTSSQNEDDLIKLLNSQ